MGRFVAQEALRDNLMVYLKSKYQQTHPIPAILTASRPEWIQHVIQPGSTNQKKTVFALALEAMKIKELRKTCYIIQYYQQCTYLPEALPWCCVAVFFFGTATDVRVRTTQ